MKSVHSRGYALDYESCVQEIQARAIASSDRVLRTRWFYRCFVTIVFGLSVYAAVEYPLLSLLFFIVGYFIHHLCFMLYHSSLHAQFIELDHRELRTGPFIAFVHHYVHPRLLCCFEHRATYQSSLMLASLLPVFLVAVFWGGLVMLPFISAFLLWHLTSAPIHEWYHMPTKQRRDYFNRFEFAVFSSLERCNLISTRRHINHHRHQLDNLEGVIEFDDMNVGKGLSRAFDGLWRWCLRRVYKPNTKRMTIFYSGLFLVTIMSATVLAYFIAAVL